MSQPENEFMVIGQIVGPFGLKGEAKVEILTDYPDRFAEMSEVLLGPGRTPTRLAGMRRHQGRLLLKLEGVETPEAVDALRGAELAVPRSEAVPLPEGHYFLDEVIGSEVIVEDGRHIGTVSDVLRTGSNDVFVTRRNGEEHLIPVIADAIVELDVPAKRIVVRDWIFEPDV
jgi:16S rRNA processing protein RimM